MMTGLNSRRRLFRLERTLQRDDKLSEENQTGKNVETRIGENGSTCS